MFYADHVQLRIRAPGQVCSSGRGQVGFLRAVGCQKNPHREHRGFSTNHHYRAVSMADYRVRNASHKGSSHPSLSSTAPHYEASSYLFGRCDDLFIDFPYSEMGLRCTTSNNPYLLYLGIQQPLRFVIKKLSFFFRCALNHFWANIVAGVMRRYSGASMNDMQLRVGFVGNISCDVGGEDRLFGAVCCQKDRGRENAHRVASFSLILLVRQSSCQQADPHVHFSYSRHRWWRAQGWLKSSTIPALSPTDQDLRIRSSAALGLLARVVHRTTCAARKVLLVTI